MDEDDLEAELIKHLETAHAHTQEALAVLLRPSGPKRSIWYRIALMRAQTGLITLHMLELQRRAQRGTDREP